MLGLECGHYAIDSGLCRVHFLRPKVVRAMAQQNLDLLKGFKGSTKNKTYAL